MLVCLTSRPDWLIAHRPEMDANYTEFQHILMEPFGEVLFGGLAGLRKLTLEAIAVEAGFPAVAALGGSFMRASTHLSGYEHVVSHLIDRQVELSGGRQALHGTQFVPASLPVSEAYRLFLDDFDPAGGTAAAAARMPLSYTLGNERRGKHESLKARSF